MGDGGTNTTDATSSSTGNVTYVYRYAAFGGATAAVPIELLYFIPILKNNTVELSWATSSEINNDYFTIERSPDGKTPEVIGGLRGNSNSTETNTYNITDPSPLSGVSYYRLKQTDFDGKFKYSGWVAVKKAETSLVDVYPNPVSNQLNYIINSEKEGYHETQVLDLSGKTLISKNEFLTNGPQMLSLDFSDLPPGTYMLRIKTNDDVFYRKIVK